MVINSSLGLNPELELKSAQIYCLEARNSITLCW